jgi:2-oxoglutarate ferredoxin oxidoreductase subunit beta
MKLMFEKPKSLKENKTIYCPGCTHGVIHRLVAEAIDKLDIREKAYGVAPVGCAVLMYDYFNIDIVEAPHGRAPALATGAKRVRNDLIVFTYQGDGDLASIGMGEIMHAANRGENITVIFVNNANYGMTGGQMAPTTLIGQKTTTTVFGRDPKSHGYPFNMAEIIGSLPAVAYSTRVKVTDPKSIARAGKAILKGFKNQIENRGFSFIEVLSTCPTNWGLTPVQALKFVDEQMEACFPLGTFKDTLEDA